MKIKVLFLTAFLFAVSAVCFAQSAEGDYVGNWSNGRAWELSLDSGTLKFSSRGNKPETLKYRDITPPNSEIFYIEIMNPKKESYFSRYIAFSFASFDEMTMTFYNTLADIKVGKNPQGNDKWFRDGVTFDDDGGVTGELKIGKTESLIFYFGEESGDYAAYCFSNNSDAGKKILAACKNGEQCEVLGGIDYEKPCKVPGLEADLSSYGTFTSVTSAKPSAKTGSAKSDAQMTADMVVKNLYDASKLDDQANPFFESKDRSRIDRFFTKDFADLIWQNATYSDGDIGAFEFDPLYNAQDTDIRDFKIGKPETGMGFTTVEVTFKNFGKIQNIRYLLEQNAAGDWKISDVRYMNGDMVKGMLYAFLNKQN